MQKEVKEENGITEGGGLISSQSINLQFRNLFKMEFSLDLHIIHGEKILSISEFKVEIDMIKELLTKIFGSL